MNIVVGSAFRNFAARVSRYMDQVARLRDYMGPEHKVRVIAVEGDSRDNTRVSLEFRSHERDLELELVTHNHGAREFGSTEHEDRMIAMSGVGNAIFDAVKDTDDVLLYVECDLIWDAPTAGALIKMAHFQEAGLDVFGPRVMAGENFYDIWGYRHLNGERFNPSEKLSSGLTEVSSIGSCLAMRGEVARRSRIRDNYCLVGWCRDARAQGYRIGVHEGLEVHHP